MIKIAICDDEKIYVDALVDKVEEYFGSRDDYKIKVFHDSNEIINSLLSYDIVFLDIEMPGVTGIELKNKLELLQFKGVIIFVTNYEQYMTEAFGRNVLSYVRKDRLEQIQIILSNYEKRTKENKVVTFGEKSYIINDILYISSQQGCIYVVTKTGEQCLTMRLGDALSHLGSDMFVRIHRSDIINMRYVDAYTSTSVTLINNKKFVLSRKYKNIFKEKYVEYILRD